MHHLVEVWVVNHALIYQKVYQDSWVVHGIYVIGNAGWQNICAGVIDAFEISGKCIAKLAMGPGDMNPYSKVCKNGFHRICKTYENGTHIQLQKSQGFCVADFAMLSDERISRSKIFLLFDRDKRTLRSKS